MADHPTDFRGGPGSPHVEAGLCADILAGLAPREAVRGAMVHLRTCPACEERFRRMAADHEDLRAGPAPRRSASGEIVLAPRDGGVAARGEHPGDPDSTRAERSRVGFFAAIRANLPRLAPPLALATAAAVILLARPWVGHVPPPGLAYWIPVPEELLAHRGDDGAEDLRGLLEGLRAYQRRDLRQAIRGLEAARATGGAEDLRRLYLASALQLSGKASRALQTVSRIDPEALPEPRRDEALWVRYVALVELGRERETEGLLDRLAASTGPIGELARRRRSVTSRDSNPDPP